MRHFFFADSFDTICCCCVAVAVVAIAVAVVVAFDEGLSIQKWRGL